MGNDIRQQIAEQAARILAEHGHLSTDRARQKAARQIGCSDQRQLPDNLEIESALKAYKQLFHGNHAVALRKKREAAKEAMKRLEEFQPQLTGQVFSGTADSNTRISLMLFAETTEEVIMRLMELTIPWREETVPLHYADGSTRRHPLLSFFAGDNEVGLLVLPTTERHHPPLDPVSGRPQKGANLKRLVQLLNEKS